MLLFTLLSKTAELTNINTLRVIDTLVLCPVPQKLGHSTVRKFSISTLQKLVVSNVCLTTALTLDHCQVCIKFPDFPQTSAIFLDFSSNCF